MASIFVDTSAWGHLAVKAQPFHKQASDLITRTAQQGFKVYTSNYVMSEVVALFTSPLRLPRHQTISFIQSIRESQIAEIVFVDEAVDAQAWDLLRNRQDKEWSLVDCSSFVIMTRLGITEALTTDHHFEQAGFAKLLGGQG
jgi:uncharacterized protein